MVIRDARGVHRGSTRIPWWRDMKKIIVVASMILSSPLHAQSTGVNVSGRFGIAGAADDYQSNCGHSSLA